MSIVVENLVKFYGGQKAVDNISFSIKKGEIVGFLGPNGARYADAGCYRAQPTMQGRPVAPNRSRMHAYIHIRISTTATCVR